MLFRLLGLAFGLVLEPEALALAAGSCLIALLCSLSFDLRDVLLAHWRPKQCEIARNLYTELLKEQGVFNLEKGNERKAWQWSSNF